MLWNTLGCSGLWSGMDKLKNDIYPTKSFGIFFSNLQINTKYYSWNRTFGCFLMSKKVKEKGNASHWYCAFVIFGFVDVTCCCGRLGISFFLVALFKNKMCTRYYIAIQIRPNSKIWFLRPIYLLSILYVFRVCASSELSSKSGLSTNSSSSSSSSTSLKITSGGRM